MKTQIYICFFIFFYLNIFSCKPLENTFKSFVDDDEIATITTDNETELEAAISILNKKGGTIYIDTAVINIQNSRLVLSGTISGGIIGLRQFNGEYPRISFLNSQTLREQSGISVDGSNKFIEYIIVEHSLTHGIKVDGSNNILDHIISRYNSGSGFLIYGNFNNLNYCYSYRNFALEEDSSDGDGFKIGGETNIVLNYCFAWDNGNNGFNYVRLLNSSDLSYLHSGSWNNGNIMVFIGKYDYDNGAPLDKNLWTIREMIKYDENFASNYYKKLFAANGARIHGIPLNIWIPRMTSIMRGEGFVFGNLNNSQTIDVKRSSFYNVAFDNKAGGFVDNYNHRYNAFVTDCVSFNNGINFKLPYYTLTRWSNNWSWNSKNKEQLNGKASLLKPKKVDSAQRTFYTVKTQIINAVYENMFPDEVNFDKAINGLKKLVN